MIVLVVIPASHLIAVVLAVILLPALIFVIAAVMFAVAVAQRHAGQREHHYRTTIQPWFGSHSFLMGKRLDSFG